MTAALKLSMHAWCSVTAACPFSTCRQRAISPWSRSGKSWVVYKRRDLQLREVRSELQVLGHVFRSESDTEMILEAHARWGIEAFKKFRGMFAFALWDSARASCICAATVSASSRCTTAGGRTLCSPPRCAPCTPRSCQPWMWIRSRWRSSCSSVTSRRTPAFSSPCARSPRAPCYLRRTDARDGHHLLVSYRVVHLRGHARIARRAARSRRTDVLDRLEDQLTEPSVPHGG